MKSIKTEKNCAIMDHITVNFGKIIVLFHKLRSEKGRGLEVSHTELPCMVRHTARVGSRSTFGGFDLEPPDLKHL